MNEWLTIIVSLGTGAGFKPWLPILHPGRWTLLWDPRGTCCRSHFSAFFQLTGCSDTEPC